MSTSAPGTTTKVAAIFRTPLLDLVRGRIASASWKQVLEQAALPEPADAVVRDTVQHTRLRRAEKADVARELVVHFADAFDAGITPDAAAEQFGDTRTAARLIRRAKKRQRGLLWQISRGMRWGVVVLLVLYGLLMLRFVVVSPEVTVDYMAKFNAPVEATPVQERAWPLYRQALMNLAIADWPDDFETKLSEFPAGTQSPEVQAFVSEHQAEIALLREASSRRHLGFVGDFEVSREDLALMTPGGVTQPARAAPAPPGSAEQLIDESVIGILLPNLNYGRTVAHLLAADARLAVEAGEADRALTDYLAILDEARQFNQQPTLVSHLVAIGLNAYAIQLIGVTLDAHPDLWDDEQLLTLAHRLAAVDIPADLSGEQWALLDTLQRIYGSDGWLTAEGAAVLARLRTLAAGGVEMNLFTHSPVANAFLGPVAMMRVASREEVTAEAQRLWALAEAEIDKPLWEVPRMRYTLESEELLARQPMRYLPITMLMSSLDHARWARLRMLANRDGLILGLALEIYRRDHGRYPSSLDDLSPRFIPELPVDPVTGRALRYRLTEDGPMIYSVGGDLDDDGGRVPTGPGGRTDPDAAFTLTSPGDGDYVLWPPRSLGD